MHPPIPTLDQPSPLRRRGFTVVEVMVSVVVLTVASYILTSTVMAAVTHSIVKRQKTSAVEAAMNLAERMRALPPEDIFALYNDDPQDDPYGAATGPGPIFNVDGLEGLIDALGVVQTVGRVLLPGQGAVLDETFDQPDFGLPRDLDGDLAIRAGDCSDRYIILPVIVRVDWLSRLGPRHFTLEVMVVDLAKFEE